MYSGYGPFIDLHTCRWRWWRCVEDRSREYDEEEEEEEEEVEEEELVETEQEEQEEQGEQEEQEEQDDGISCFAVAK